MNRTDSRVTQDAAGNVFVSCDLPVNVADELIALLRANPIPALAEAVENLAHTLTDAYTAVLADVFGCPNLIPGSDPVILTEPAITESMSGTMSVLLPGMYNRGEAAMTAITAIAGYATERGIDMDDPNLAVTIHQAEWMVLHHCDADDHDFHPQASDAGNAGAILVTVVDLEMESFPVAVAATPALAVA